MVDWNRKFRSEYDAAREVLACAAAFDADWQPVVAQLAQLMGREGFDVARAEALAELRRRATRGADATSVDEADGLLRAAGHAASGLRQSFRGATMVDWNRKLSLIHI